MTSSAHPYPVSELDPFSTQFLSEPHSFQEQLREAGPVVWFERYGIWGIARHEQVHAVPGDWETFCSSAGRENLLPYGSMVFNAFGRRNRLFEEPGPVASAARRSLAGACMANWTAIVRPLAG